MNHKCKIYVCEESDWIRGTNIPYEGGMNSHVMSPINHF